MNSRFSVVTAVLCLLLSAPLPAQDEPPPVAEDSAGVDTARAFMASLHPQHGEVTLPGGIAALRLSDEFYYLNPEDAKKLLTQGWSNPPEAAEGVLGMILPARGSPLSENGWGVVISYDDDGHVSDADADKINYTELLGDMKKQAEESNEERKKSGYPEVQLAGWAENPHYDGGAKKIYWAKDLAFSDGKEHTLNYFVRVLGRKGVLELNAIASMGQLSSVRRDMQKVLGFTDFTTGNRYADFNTSTDKVAAYGLAALVAGGIAAKTGLLAKLGLLLLAAKKFIVLIFVAIAGAFKKFFGRKS